MTWERGRPARRISRESRRLKVEESKGNCTRFFARAALVQEKRSILNLRTRNVTGAKAVLKICRLLATSNGPPFGGRDMNRVIALLTGIRTRTKPEYLRKKDGYKNMWASDGPCGRSQGARGSAGVSDHDKSLSTLSSRTFSRIWRARRPRSQGFFASWRARVSVGEPAAGETPALPGIRHFRAWMTARVEKCKMLRTNPACC